MVKEYRGIAFERPKTWWGRLFDCTPEECYQDAGSIADVLIPKIPKDQIPNDNKLDG